MLKKILSVFVATAMCLVLSTAMPMANAAEITGFDGNGTEVSPYLISSAADLQRLAETVNSGNDCSGSYFRLENDIDLKEAGICGPDINGEDVSWVPIGADDSKNDSYFYGTAFCGIFDGNDHEISGLYINTPSRSDPYPYFTGLFGCVGEKGVVKNLRVNGDVKGCGYVGGVVGRNRKGTIDNCSNHGKVYGSYRYIGGVVGDNYIGTVTDCSNFGEVSGSSYSYLSGGGSRNVGGVVGENLGPLDKCLNYGTVFGSESVGGVAGTSTAVVITNCGNIGKVSGEHMIGGVVGYIYDYVVDYRNIMKNCYNAGYVEGKRTILQGSDGVCIGGVAGSFSSGKMQNCYNIGEIYSIGSCVGGVAGEIYANSAMQNCYNTGKVSGAGSVGGITGRLGTSTTDPSYVSKLENCYNIGEISGKSEVGNVAGRKNSTSVIKNVYYPENEELKGIGNDNKDNVAMESKPESSFISGEVAYLLQAGQVDDGLLVWGQRITIKGEHDGSPVLTDNEAYRALKADFSYNNSSAVKYANPDTVFAPPNEAFPEPPEGYILGWTTVQGGKTAEFYYTVAIGDKDSAFYGVVVSEPEPQDPDFDPPKAIEGLVYDGTKQELITEGSATGGTMVYSLSEDEDYSENIPVGTDAGEYKVWYMVKGDKGYNDTEPESLTAEIAKADPVPPETDLTATVGQTLADIEQQLPKGYAWVDRTESVGSAGENSFAATFTPDDTDNYNILSLTLTVRVTEPEQEPQDPVIIHPKAREELVYDRTEQELITAGSAAGGTMVYKAEKKEENEQETDGYDLAMPDAEGYSDVIPTGTNAGEYTVWYKVIWDEDYSETEPESLTVKIARADPVPPETDLTAVVGQTLADIEPQLPEGYAWADRTQSVGDVGENSFAATFTPKDTKNLNILENLMLTVKVTEPGQEPQEPEYTSPKEREGLVYNGAEQELITAGSATKGTMVYKAEKQEETAAYDPALPDSEGYSDAVPTGTGAGEYTVWYKVIWDEDYSETGPESLTVRIAKADPTPPETNLTAVVGQTLADIEPQLPEGYAWVDRTQSVGNAGEHSFAAIFTPNDTDNYNILSLTLTVKVREPEPAKPEPTEPEVTPPRARDGLVYDRTEQELITAGSAKGGTMVYKIENKDNEEQETAAYDFILFDFDGYSNTVPTGTDAGEYTVWYKVIGDEGYSDTEPESLTAVIAKADPVLPETDLTATVGQTLKDVKLSEGFAWVDDTQSVGNAGTNYFPAIFTPADTKNFNTVVRDLPVKVTNPERPAETTTITVVVITTAAAASETTAAAATTATQTELTTAAATTAPEPTTEPASAASPPSGVTEPEDEDKIPNTGIVLVAAPFVVSTITVVVSKKRK